MKILKTISLSKFFDGLKALNKVNIDVEGKTLTLIIGPNGSGKTTFINTVCGFYKPDDGRVYFLDKDITGLPPNKVYEMGIVRTFQIPQPLKRLTVLENLLIAEKNVEGLLSLRHSSWIKKEEEVVEKAFKILEFLKIDHLWDVESYKLSGGQLKLVEVGRALMTNPKMIITDEPIAGIAPALAHEILERFLDLKKMGITFLIVEHRLDIVMGYVDFVYVMANGEVISKGKPEEVMNDPKVVEVYLGVVE
ncbi:MAG: ABC transporter ATP-binding protein [Archaeoglobales archaeon]|nr:MAG: ABC transporter ATP-binding protein [Archaeoglobales archaeon]